MDERDGAADSDQGAMTRISDLEAGRDSLAAQLEEAQKVIEAARSHVHDWTSINPPDQIPLPIAEIRDALAAYDELVAAPQEKEKA